MDVSTIYVDANAEPDGDGSKEHPFRTIAEAMQAFPPPSEGHHLAIAPGYYETDEVMEAFFSVSGSSGGGTEVSLPRPHTKDEMVNMLLKHLRHLAHYWATTKLGDDTLAYCKKHGQSELHYRVEGAMFSALTMLDGETDLPAFHLVPDPHPEDEDYCREQE